MPEHSRMKTAGTSPFAPKASALLLTYNQQQYVEEALESLLKQDTDNLEVVVSDDSSSDATWALVNDMAARYQGPKQLILNRNPRNLGIVGNYFRAFDLSTGDVIFTAAGDDVSLPNRVSQCLACWQTHARKPDLVAADALDMAIDGTILGEKPTDPLENWDLLRWNKTRPFMFGASHMMTRRLLAVRPLNPALAVEDQNLLVRALMMGGAVRCANMLVKHRRGGISQSGLSPSYQQKKAKFLQSANQALIETDELVLDAHVLQYELRIAVTPARRLNSFILELLGANGFVERIRTTIRYRDVPMRKHVKYLSFSLLAPLHTLSLRIKQFFRSR